ncbi:MAG: hypothetical protein AB8B97_13900 [Granulosicoccus sp.]
MKFTPTSTIARTCGAALTAALLSTTAHAHEPGVLPTIPTGASMGVPIAAPAPFNGISVSSRTGFSFQHYYDNDGNKTPTEITLRDTVL